MKDINALSYISVNFKIQLNFHQNLNLFPENFIQELITVKVVVIIIMTDILISLTNILYIKQHTCIYKYVNI